MKKMLSILCILMLLCSCAQADWVCQAVFTDGAVCGTTNADGSGWCQWCGEDEPVHDLRVVRSGNNFLRLVWHGAPSVDIEYAVSGTGNVMLAAMGVTDKQYTLADLQPGTSYDISLVLPDFSTVSLTASTSGGSAPAAADIATPASGAAASVFTPVPARDGKAESAQAGETLLTHYSQVIPMIPQIVNYTADGSNLTIVLDRELPAGSTVSCNYYAVGNDSESLSQDIKLENSSSTVTFTLNSWDAANYTSVRIRLDLDHCKARLASGDVECSRLICDSYIWSKYNFNTFGGSYVQLLFGGDTYFNSVSLSENELNSYSFDLKNDAGTVIAFIVVKKDGSVEDVYPIDANGNWGDGIYSDDPAIHDYDWVASAYPLGFGMDAPAPAATPAPAAAVTTAPAQAPSGSGTVVNQAPRTTTAPHGVSDPLYLNNTDEVAALLPKVVNFMASGNDLTMFFDKPIPAKVKLSCWYHLNSGKTEFVYVTTTSATNGVTFTLPDWNQSESLSVDVPFDASRWVLRTSLGELSSKRDNITLDYWLRSRDLTRFDGPSFSFSPKNNEVVDYLSFKDGKLEGLYIFANDEHNQLIARAHLNADGSLSYLTPYENGREGDTIYSSDPKRKDYLWIPEVYPFRFDGSAPISYVGSSAGKSSGAAQARPTTAPHTVSNPIYFDSAEQLCASVPKIANFMISGDTLTVFFDQTIPANTKVSCYHYKNSGDTKTEYVTTTSATNGVSFTLSDLNASKSMKVGFPMDATRWVLRTPLGELAAKYKTVDVGYWRWDSRPNSFEGPDFNFHVANNQVVDSLSFDKGKLEYAIIFAMDDSNQLAARACMKNGKLSWFERYENGREMETVYSSDARHKDYEWIEAAYPFTF